MTEHATGTREEWLAARLQLLEAEKKLTRRSDELARQRQQLPWVRIDKDYRFDIADGYDGFVVHLENHDVTMMAVSQAPLAHIQDYSRRMRWSFPWASALPGDFNYDFNVSVTEEQQREGVVEYNFASRDVRPILEAGDESPVAEFAAGVGTDTAAFMRQAPGLSAFALEDGVVYHTYSAYARGLDGLWGMYQWLDRAPKGRNETGVWWRRHDEYDKD
jgi:predicted dithiol-disulfide oxidoreductase (DUF899 family)